MKESLHSVAPFSETLTGVDVPAFQYGNWQETEQAFEQAPSVEYGQAWYDEVEPSFMPGRVKIGRHGSTLLFFAVLEDKDIHTSAAAFGDPVWSLGDTFEIFLRPESRELYYELHVAPNNCDLQLRWPSADTLKEMKDLPKDAWKTTITSRPIMQSWTKVEPENDRWLVLAAVDGAYMAEENGDTERYDEWRISFSRYDYTEGQEPVLSSVSPHVEVDFHRQQEWRLLSFAR